MATLSLHSATASSFQWQVTGLGSYWDDGNYTKCVLSSGTTTSGSSTPPSGIVDTAYPPTAGTTYNTPNRSISASAGTTYTRYAYTQAKNGLYYLAGSATITTPSTVPGKPTGIYFSVNGKNITAYWTKGSNATHTYLDYSWVSGTYDASTTGSSYSFTVPNFSSTYSVDFISFNSSSNEYSAWTGFISFTSGPDPTPAAPTGVRTNVISSSQINLGWDAVSGAEGYNYFMDGVYKGYTTNNFTSFTGLGQYTYHTFKVRSTKSGYESGDSATVGAYTDDVTIPTAKIDAVTPTNSRISISYSGTDAHSGIVEWQMFISPPGSSTLYYKTSYNNATSHTFETDGNGNPLSGGNTYTVGVKTRDAYSNYSTTATYTVTLPRTRPANWNWLVSGKYSGGPFNLTADEWFKFCTRINDFRDYKGLSYFSFTDPVVGGVFGAYMFNQARTAIIDLPRTVSVPGAVSTGDNVTAAGLNGLRDALNSTT